MTVCASETMQCQCRQYVRARQTDVFRFQQCARRRLHSRVYVCVVGCVAVRVADYGCTMMAMQGSSNAKPCDIGYIGWLIWNSVVFLFLSLFFLSFSTLFLFFCCLLLFIPFQNRNGRLKRLFSAYTYLNRHSHAYNFTRTTETDKIKKKTIPALYTMYGRGIECATPKWLWPF